MDESLVARYPDLERSHFWWRTRRRLIGDLVADLSIELQTVLDVGCGAGVTAREVAKLGVPVVGVDLEPEPEPEPGTVGSEDFTYLCGNFLDLAPDLGEYSVVLALDAVEHFEDEGRVLRAIHETTSPGGVAIVTVPAYSWLWSTHDEENRHFRRYTRKRLKDAMADAGFTVERVGYIFGGLLPPKAIIAFTEQLGFATLPIANVPSHTLNRLAEAYFRTETELACRLRNFLPFGTSVLAIASRPTRGAHVTG